MIREEKPLKWTDTMFHRCLVGAKFNFLQSTYPNASDVANRTDRSIVLEDHRYEVRTFEGEERLKERIKKHLERAWHLAANENVHLPDPEDFRISILKHPVGSWLPFLKHYFVSIQLLKEKPEGPISPGGPSSAA